MLVVVEGVRSSKMCVSGVKRTGGAPGMLGIIELFNFEMVISVNSWPRRVLRELYMAYSY